MENIKEREVKINGIQISKTGFKNLQFEAARYSDGLDTIRGFGKVLNEQNLTTIDTVSMDFVLNHYELKELANIYCLFKANGILPIENEYLLNKIKSTYEKGKTDEEIKKDVFIKKDITHLICFLQRLSLTSIDRTNNAYQVNMILTLYNNVLTKKEYEDYMAAYSDWLKETNFDSIFDNSTKEIMNELNSLSDIEMKIYNVETLNSTYKEHILNVSSINAKLNLDTESLNEQKAEKQLEKSKIELLKNKKTLDIDKLGTIISIPNHSILQIELITNNNISNVPIKGSPISLKSYLGIGDSHFSAKLIFNEYENDIVEQLKRISDKNIINHKIELNHPLVQLFDFHTSNILNMTFNNLEEANGIMVNIIFSLNGFRYSEETTINTDELLDKLNYDNDYKQEEIGGLYLECILDYFYRKRKIINYSSLQPFLYTILESIVINNDGDSNNYNTSLFTHDYHVVDFLASYSSLPTSFGVHSFIDNNALTFKNLFLYSKNELLNSYFNNSLNDNSKTFNKDIFLLNNSYDAYGIDAKDTNLNSYRALFNGYKYYSYIDSIAGISLLGNTKYKNYVLEFMYSNYFTNKSTYDYIMNNNIKEISVELFNTKQNGDLNIYSNEVYKKLYEEFLYRLFYNLNINHIDLIDKIKELSYLSNNEEFINFRDIHKSISLLSDNIYESFIQTLYDENFIERITREVIDDHLKDNQKEQIKDVIEYKINEAKDNVKDFAIEFISEYENNKEVIKNRSYNIFLTKLSYFLSIYISSQQGAEYEDKFKFSFDNLIKIFIISSAIHSVLLTKTTTRTDHFEKFIILGMKNIGYKISTYNSRLEKQKLYDNEGNIIETRDIMFYELFNKSIESVNPFYFYKSRINFDDFKYEVKNLFDNNPNKDINFFYGNKIKQLMLYKKLFNIATPEKYKESLENTYVFINENKKYFIDNSYRNSSDEALRKKVFLYTNDLDINNIDFPVMNFGFIPSHYTELFYDDSVNKKSYYMKDITKQRVIGNIDPFKNLEEITNIIFENENYIMPDYDICIYKKEYSSDYAGEMYKTINSKIYMFLKNAASISIVKNPKTKIKSMTVVLNNTSKSIFNFDPNNGSFDMKSLNKGKIDIVHIEPGDEIRVRVGFDEKIQLFNGFINVIENTGNQLVLNCSSFASLLYNEKISELNMTAGISVWSEIKKVFKTATNQIKTTLEKISSEQIDIIRSMHNITNPLNNHLFKSFNGKEYYNNIFVRGEKASMYTAFNLGLSYLKTVSAEKFIKSKVSDITQSKIVWEVLAKKSLGISTGNTSLDYQSANKTYDIFTNINNVDRDYETYGIYKDSSDSNPLSVNYYNYESGDKNYINANNKEKTKNNDILLTEKENITKTNDNIPYIKNDEKYGLICLPVDKETNIITSLFKERRSYGEHKGIDICCNGNSSKIIYAVADGIVISVIENNYGSAGKYIKIKHKIPDQDKYFVSAYMHLDTIAVSLNQEVVLGQKIGIMGNTGRSSGEHLHFEMYTLDNHLEKYMYLNPFDENILPRNNWNVAWSLVNINADNGQYTEEWKEAYSKSKKMIASKNRGR